MGDEHPVIASDLFLYTSGIPELKYDDFEFVTHAADGGSGSVFKYRRIADGQLVALKFFGLKGCQRPSARAIEQEIELDWKLNNIVSTASCYGYIIDSYEGYVSSEFRPDLRCPGKFTSGKEYKGRYLIKVSECLEKDIMGVLVDDVKFTHRAASTVFCNLIQALQECHDVGLIHRDLKPDNFMFVKANVVQEAIPSPTGRSGGSFTEEGKVSADGSRRRKSIDVNTSNVSDLDIKLIDFGASAYLGRGQTELAFNGPPRGTVLYYAPETLTKKVHSKATDIWQAACTLWVILFTEYPFRRNPVHDLDTFTTSKRLVPNPSFTGELSFPEHKMRVPDNCKDLFRRMFELDPSRRITCEQILSHSWIRDFASLDDDDFGEEYRKSLKDFKHSHTIRKLIERQVQRRNVIKSNVLTEISVLGETSGTPRGPGVVVTTTQHQTLKRLFLETIGFDGTSPITIKDGVCYGDFCRILTIAGIPQLATRRVFDYLDVDGNDTIDYFEFFSVLQSFREVTSYSTKTDIVENRAEVELDERCRFYFELFDYDGTDRISRNEFHAVLVQMTMDFEEILYDDEGITKIFDLVDIDQSGWISFSEFRGWFEAIFSGLARNISASSNDSSHTVFGSPHGILLRSTSASSSDSVSAVRQHVSDEGGYVDDEERK